MKNKINVLYVSTLCSERLIAEMLDSKLGISNLAAQKYHRLLAQGMVLNSDKFDLKALSVPDFNKGMNGEKVIFTNPEIEKGVKYTYVPIVLVPILKQLIVAVYLFYKITKWKTSNKYKQNIIIFDILNLSTSLIAILTSKITGIRSVAIVTDLPELMFFLKDELSVIDRLTYSLQNIILSTTYGYVVLTEAINQVINKKSKPFCIIEGLTDILLLAARNKKENINVLKIIHYSGGLYEKFGVKALIDAFMLIKREDIRLHLFGNGELIAYIEKCIENDSRIVFFGYQENNAVLKDQLHSFVLVNPRFTHEEYTKYSFPSKTIEYMASGIPLLTTKLPGIPPEYLNFVYLFEDESVTGYKNSLINILSKPSDEMHQFGKQSRDFVLKNKNNKIQAKKFYDNFIH